MKFFQRYLKPLPAPPVNTIWREIEERKLGFDSFVYWSGQEAEFEVTLRLERDKVECRVKGNGRTFDEALNSAWERWPRS